MRNAPVVIPTLNRYEHLKKCIESLRQNNLACNTELYISLDYPPHEKYESGYREVKKYLQSNIQGFQDVHIYYQTSNLGAFYNSYFLFDEVLRNHDYFIFTEDDNVFSPNYLEYINACLNQYQSNEDIVAVCGYSYPIKWDCNNDALLLSQNIFPAWGYAIWKERWNEIRSFRKEDIQKYLLSSKNTWKLYKKSKRLFIEAVQIATEKHYLALNASKELEYIDSVIGIYLHIANKKIVLPVISKVENIGYDGSGLHCESKAGSNGDKASKLFDSRFDTNKEYRFDKMPERNISKSEEKRLNHYIKVRNKELIKTWILWVFFKIKLLPRKEKV